MPGRVKASRAILLTVHDIVSHNPAVTEFAAPEDRGASFLRIETGRTARAWRLTAVFCAAFALLALIGSTSGRAGDAALRAVDVDKPAFRLTDPAGAEMALAALRGRPVLVHFFATWCEPCREELPALSRLVARAQDKQLAVVAVSVAEVPVRVRRFLEQMPVSFPVLLDEDRAVSKSWGVDALPTTFILNADLKPRLAVEQDFDWDRIDIATILEQLGRKEP